MLEPDLSNVFNFRAIKFSKLVILVCLVPFNTAYVVPRVPLPRLLRLAFHWQVHDESDGALPSTLVSLNGDNFRSNNFSDTNGELTYTNLVGG